MRLLIILSILCVPLNNTALSAAPLPLDQLSVPPGFKISVYADGIENARSMAWGSEGNLFVGSRDAGKVYVVTPKRAVITLAEGLTMPNGVAFRDGALYVAEINRIIRFNDIEKRLGHPAYTYEVINDSYPDEQHHGWKFIAFGPDGLLYVPQGAPCNICDPNDPYASLTRLNIAEKKPHIFARGIRNTVGFDWHPKTHDLWFTDNGRDWLGDDAPPDELNRADRDGMHFGFPYCHGGNLLDPNFGVDKHCSDYTAPEQQLGPHVAALGMRFYTGTMFPAAYRNQIFIAEHGSWNRSKRSGYRVMLVKLDAKGHPSSYEPFVQGWLKNEKAWGRPVDVIVAKDGSLLVSDDQANAIYQITFSPA